MAPGVQLAPEPVSRGKHLWTWDGTTQLRLAGRFPVRMTIAGFPLPHGRLGLVVVAPLAPTPAVQEWLQQTGDVSFVVAPNKHHWWWAAAFKAAFPGSLLVAPLALALKERQLPVDVRVTPLAGAQDLPGSWPADVLDVQPVAGLPLLEELALFHKPSATLILTDTAFNFDPAWLAEQCRPSAVLRAYLRLAGGHRRCCVTKTFRFLIKDPAAFKASLDSMLASWEFKQVCVAHGAFIGKDSNAKQALVEGSLAFADELLQERQRRAAGGGGGALAGTAVAVAVTAGLLATALGIGVAGILKARQG